MSTPMRRIRRTLLGGVVALASIPLVGAAPSGAAECVTGELCIKFNSTVGGKKTITKVGVTRDQIQEWAAATSRNLAYRTRSKAGEPAETQPTAERALTLRTLIKKVNPDRCRRAA